MLDGNFLPGSRPHNFILIVTSIICFVVIKFLSFSLTYVAYISIRLQHAIPYVFSVNAAFGTQLTAASDELLPERECQTAYRQNHPLLGRVLCGVYS